VKVKPEQSSLRIIGLTGSLAAVSGKPVENRDRFIFYGFLLITAAITLSRVALPGGRLVNPLSLPAPAEIPGVAPRVPPPLTPSQAPQS